MDDLGLVRCPLIAALKGAKGAPFCMAGQGHCRECGAVRGALIQTRRVMRSALVDLKAGNISWAEETLRAEVGAV